MRRIVTNFTLPLILLLLCFSQVVAETSGSMVTRRYDVYRWVADKVAPAGAEADWEKVFSEMGVPWPEGSSIVYVSSLGKLVVVNTPDNLSVFEEILKEINVLPPQVEIEVRFVEVTATGIDSLGFEWLLTDDWEIMQQKDLGSKPTTTKPRIQMKANAAGGGFTKGDRHHSQFRDPSKGELPMSDDLTTIASVLTNQELAMVLHALQQRGHADILSAPRITTQSGTRGTIMVGTEYRYATEVVVKPVGATNDIDTSSSNLLGTVVVPGGFVTRDVGISLSVLPIAERETGMINLNIKSEIVDEPTWKDYGAEYTAADGSEKQIAIPQPFFPVRSIQTTVSIFNGATVVLGGMVTERHTEVEHRTPILGWMPLIGRYFRKTNEQIEKRNLMIFITARKVDTTGRPVTKQKSVKQ